MSRWPCSKPAGANLRCRRATFSFAACCRAPFLAWRQASLLPARYRPTLPLVGALIFPVGLISIVLLGLELVTGSFALVPLPWLEREASAGSVVVNWGWVFIGNLIGSVAYGALLAIALTNMGATAPAGVAARIVQIAELKTTGYSALGFAGLVSCFVKAMLCNWLVCLAIVLAMTTTSTIGKIACAWMPIFIFFAQRL